MSKDEGGRMKDEAEAEPVAGRELDVELALFMGWARTPNDHGADYLLPPKGSASFREGRVHKVPHYSTNIEAALQIAQRLAESTSFGGQEYGYLTLSQLGAVPEHSGWAATFLADNDLAYEWWEAANGLPDSARAETAPLAVCRAALKTIRARQS